MSFNTVSISDQPALGATAVAIPRPAPASDKGGVGSQSHKCKEVLCFNSHATQIVYVARNRVATATDYDLMVDGNSKEVLKLRDTDTYISVIASGASNPASFCFGNEAVRGVG